MEEEPKPNLAVLILVWLSFIPGLLTYLMPLVLVGGVTLWLASVIMSVSRPGEMAFPAIMIYSFAFMGSLLCAGTTTVVGLGMGLGPLFHAPARKWAAASLLFNLSPWIVAGFVYGGLLVFTFFGSFIAGALG